MFPYAGSSIASGSDPFISSDSVELPPSRFCNMEVVSKDGLDTSLGGLNEYDEQQIRSLFERDRVFEEDLATLNRELTEDGSFLALEQSEKYLSSSVQAFPVNGPKFLVHQDSDLMFSGEDSVGQPDQNYDADDFPIDDEGMEEILNLAELKPPPSTSLSAEIPHQISFDVSGKPLPFIRPPFPAPMLDRSPIQGLNSRTVLRTCFRIGEALNAATASLRSAGAPDTLMELYCRSLSSIRDPTTFKQIFQFGDLFSSASPPFLTGTYVTWRGIGLWDHDSRVFLGEDGKGKMARVVGKMKRLRKQDGVKMWEIVVMSVWEADWEDVGIAKGIVLA